MAARVRRRGRQSPSENARDSGETLIDSGETFETPKGLFVPKSEFWYTPLLHCTLIDDTSVNFLALSIL